MKHNFQNYVLEDLSLSEKVELFQSAEIIAASHGSGLTNMIFMKEGTNLIDIRDGKPEKINPMDLSSPLEFDFAGLFDEASQSAGFGSTNLKERPMFAEVFGKEKLLESGADVLVAGSYVFHSNNPKKAISVLKNL